jgi:hypothetical protein
LGFAAQHADDIFRYGPETLAAASVSILCGTISNYEKRITEEAGTGDDSVPLRWVISGELTVPAALKGQALTGPVRFSRSGNSPFVTGDVTRPYWLAEYGEIAADDTVVIFREGTEELRLTVVPSRSGEQDLIGLIQDILPIQGRKQQSERHNAWQAYTESAATEQARKAALRSLIREKADWTQFAVALDHVLAGSQPSRTMQSFCFGIVVYGIKEGEWVADHERTAEFLCRTVTSERDPSLLLQYVLNFKLLLEYCDRKFPEREPLQNQIFGCLKSRESQGPLDKQVRYQFDMIRAAYPGRL